MSPDLLQRAQMAIDKMLRERIAEQARREQETCPVCKKEIDHDQR